MGWRSFESVAEKGSLECLTAGRFIGLKVYQKSNVRGKPMILMNKRFVTVLLTAAVTMTLSSAQEPMPKTATERVRGTTAVTTEQLHGTVVYVAGNTLVVRMSTGELREFQVAPSEKFMIDGKELKISELKAGTTLSATITRTTTPVTARTTTIGSGKVWFVNGNTVVVTLPNQENRMYTVTDSYRFNVHGKPSSVHELRPGMIISAERIVEEPVTEITTDTVVTGQAPRP
jgi:hypothetical protein